MICPSAFLCVVRVYLWSTHGVTMLIAMHRMFRPSSRPFRTMLAMAMLAWAMLAFGASVRPIDEGGGAVSGPKAVAASSMTTHCEAMSHHQDGTAPGHPQSGHGCCQGGGCYCSSCSSAIAGVAPFLGDWQSVRARATRPNYSAPGLTHTAPELRPPIA